MSKLSNAFVAAFGSRILVAGLGLLVLPIYYKMLGADNFGVIGFFLSLQVMVSFFDLGLGATLIRKLSLYQKEALLLTRRYAKTFEILYFLLAAVVALVLMVGSNWLANHWVQAKSNQLLELPNQLRMAALTICMVWFSSIYSSMLIGLEQQFKLALSQAALALARFTIPLCAVLWHQDLTAFFFAHLLVAVLQVVLMRWVAIRQLPPTTESIEVDFSLIRQDAGFSIGMVGIFLTTLFITQTDKIILSKFLSLADFGLYTLCVTLAGGIYLAVQPLFNLLLPRFTRLIEAGADSELRHLYHLGAQLMALMVIPISALIITFPREILFVWTAQPDIAERGALMLRLLVLANAINAIMNLPYSLQLASGWTGLPLKVNYVVIIILLPTMVWAVRGWGAVGGAAVTLHLHLAILCVIPHVTHEKLLLGEKLHWYKYGLIIPSLVCALLMWIVSQLWSSSHHRLLDLLMLMLILILSIVINLFCTSELRRFLLSFLQQRLRTGLLKGRYG